MNPHDPLTEEIFTAFLKCPYKAYLKLTGARGEKSDYEMLQSRLAEEYKVKAGEVWPRKRHAEVVIHSPPSLQDASTSSATIIIGVQAQDDKESCRLDALERVTADGPQSVPRYVPVLFVRHERVTSEDRMLLGFGAVVLARLQVDTAEIGKIVHGSRFSLSKVDLEPLTKEVRGAVDQINSYRNENAAPRLVLNKHCPECEFRIRCHAAAVEKDDLSLLNGLSLKESSEQNRKGVFTVTQYSYTFRPGRLMRAIEAGAARHDHALQALALREKTVYVAQRPAIPDGRVSIYLDVEGQPEPDRFYLIGLLIVEERGSRPLSFWANGRNDEPAMWASFLQAIASVGEDFVLFYYGSYETRFLKMMGERHGGNEGLLAKIESRSVNVLSLIYGHIYFPVFANDLKSVAGFLGFHWSTPGVSGRQAIVWRDGWEATCDECLKQRLVTYNLDDCAALRRVTEAVRSFGGVAQTGGDAAGPRVVGVEDIVVPRGHKFCDPEYVLPEFEHVAKCSYFDYQRARVLFRTSPAVKQANRRKERQRRPACKVNQVVEYRGPDRCPHCGSDDFGVQGRNSRLAVDLKSVGGALKRWVTRHVARRYLCRQCGGSWLPDAYVSGRAHKYGRPHKYGWNLCGWVAYATVALRQTNEATVEALGDLYGVPVLSAVVSKLRNQAADRYQTTYETLLAALRRGGLVHVDETWAKVKRAKKKGYVWVFASPEAAVYVYSPTREGDTVRETLAGFKGVLVSDFYAAYDGMDCAQQKCLVHLVRDLNDDLVKHAFDKELKEMAGRFAGLMQAIVETIDRYGLKQHHLHKHKQGVDRFFAQESAAAYGSEVARHYRQRFQKYRDKLFTFLDHDGVPWNNNNAENAVKRFVSRRKGMGGTGAFSEQGLRDFLVLLSIYQTLRYRGASFWKFLQSGQTDIDEFLRTCR
jgi:predicted RecB family nuclease